MPTAASTLSALSPAPVEHGAPPDEIGGYRIERIPRPGETYIAAAPNGRRVVLKMFEADCLNGSHLHPNIRDRLGRVREAATVSLANLLGAERDGKRVYLVWEYVEGMPLADALAGDAKSAADRDALESPLEVLLLVREVLLAVNSLHALGLVHGALHGNNIFICRGRAGERQIILTHVSPFLYSEPAEDVAAIVSMLTVSFGRRGQENFPLGRLLNEPDITRAPLDRVIASLSALIDLERSSAAQSVPPSAAALEKAAEPPAVSDIAAERRRRLWSLVKVALAVLAGVVVFVGLQRILPSAPTPVAPVYQAPGGSAGPTP